MKTQLETQLEEAQRLAERFKSVKNRAQFAREFKVPGGPSMIYQHIQGLRPISLECAAAYAKGFNCTIEEISPSASKPFDNLGEPIKAFDSPVPPVAVTVNRVRFFIKDGRLEEETMEDPLFFRKEWLKQRGLFGKNLKAIDVIGESMEPGLYNGDTVVINREDSTPEDGGVFFLRYEEKTVLHRLIRDAGKWWLSSDNADKNRFPRKEATKEVCEILGKVVFKFSSRI